MTSGIVAQLRTSNLVGARCRAWTMVFNMCDHTLHANAGMHQLRGGACITSRNPNLSAVDNFCRACCSTSYMLRLPGDLAMSVCQRLCTTNFVLIAAPTRSECTVALLRLARRLPLEWAAPNSKNFRICVGDQGIEWFLGHCDSQAASQHGSTLVSCRGHGIIRKHDVHACSHLHTRT